MDKAELIYQEVKTLPEHLNSEVLDFIGHLKTRHDVKPAMPTDSQAVNPEDHVAWCERLNQLRESQPMTSDDTVAEMRHEARY